MDPVSIEIPSPNRLLEPRHFTAKPRYHPLGRSQLRLKTLYLTNSFANKPIVRLSGCFIPHPLKTFQKRAGHVNHPQAQTNQSQYRQSNLIDPREQLEFGTCSEGNMRRSPAAQPGGSGSDSGPAVVHLCYLTDRRRLPSLLPRIAATIVHPTTTRSAPTIAHPWLAASHIAT